MTLTVQELQERVDRGARMLDEEIPDWPTRIDPQHLAMNDVHHCVLGQLFMERFRELRKYEIKVGATDWEVGAPYYLGVRTLLDRDYEEVEAHGFTLNTLEDEPDFSDEIWEGWWSLLAELWIEAAKDRLNEGVQLRP